MAFRGRSARLMRRGRLRACCCNVNGCCSLVRISVFLTAAPTLMAPGRSSLFRANSVSLAIVRGRIASLAFGRSRRSKDPPREAHAPAFFAARPLRHGKCSGGKEAPNPSAADRGGSGISATTNEEIMSLRSHALTRDPKPISPAPEDSPSVYAMTPNPLTSLEPETCRLR